MKKLIESIARTMTPEERKRLFTYIVDTWDIDELRRAAVEDLCQSYTDTPKELAELLHNTLFMDEEDLRSLLQQLSIGVAA